MSEVNHPHDEAGPHHGPIRTPKQLVLAVFFAFVVPIIAIILLVSFVAAEKQSAAGSDAHTAKATDERIRPIGSVQVKDVSDPSALKSGDQVYTAVCAACHATGTLNAPKFGDAGAWGPRITQGFDKLLTSALKGKGAMPAQGGGDFADLEIARAVVYMANQGGAKFEEPKAPAAGSAAAAAAPAAPATTTAAAPAAAATPAPAATTTAAPQAAAATGAAPALYTQACSACHIAGVAGAPKVGDKAAWAPRVGQGIDALTASVIKGKGAMPPKGGTTASDADIKTAVSYMVNASK
ncbi:c-type cytochrome [Piscinibacter sp. XHJ-5]|uniref:c-type cytochrome n=1 Tax=Piscinibacter sp. XHJ-5 TaxID=3037797 RepID=UPI002452AB64|nr:c-type cytochrome [Piscinibacter sp. XHJ-5]